MLERLKAAAADAVVIGVKWAIIAALVLYAVSLTLGDYLIVRQRAYNGQLAYEAIEAARQQQPVPRLPQAQAEEEKPSGEAR